MDGKYNNKVGGPVNNKIKFLSIYKFSIANENTKCRWVFFRKKN